MSDVGSPAGSPARDEHTHNAANDSPNEANETNDSPEANEANDVNEASDNEPKYDAPDASDKASDAGDDDLLSEIDEDQFEDYDPETANIEDRPVEIDEDVARTLNGARRKRGDAEKPKKPKEGRREKKKRDRDAEPEGVEDEGRPRKSRRGEGGGSRVASKRASPVVQEEDDDLTPEERRRRALDRALDAAVKGPTRRKKKRGDEVRGFLTRLCSTVYAHTNSGIRTSTIPSTTRSPP